jgi:phage tail protein X
MNPKPEAIPASPQSLPAPGELSEVKAPEQEPLGAGDLALPPGCPTALGKLRIKPGLILSDVISKVYGVYRVAHLNRIEAANPGVGDLNRVPAGSAIILPAIPLPMPQAARKGAWIRLESYASLQKAWEALEAAPADGPKLRLVPWWSPADGLRFDMVVRGPFVQEAAAEALLRTLPPAEASQARVVRLDAEGAVYFTDITGWKL